MVEEIRPQRTIDSSVVRLADSRDEAMSEIHGVHLYTDIRRT